MQKGLVDAAGILVLSLSFTALAHIAPVLAGLLTGAWWPLYGACMVLFFGISEIRILCRHCPFYAEREAYCTASATTARLSSGPTARDR